MAVAPAIFTFDFVRQYSSLRDSAVPGSGSWAAPVTIFDGSAGAPDLGGTFSAGSLIATPTNKGFIVQDGLSRLVFIGNGIPDTKHIITVTGEGNIRSVDYWDTYQGAIYHGTDSYIVFASTDNGIKIAKSADNWATAGTVKDGANGPSALRVGPNPVALQHIDNLICVATWFDDTETDMGIWEFNLATDLWTLVSHAVSNLQPSLNSFTNGLFKFPNGDYLVVYVSSTFGVHPVVRLYNKGTNTWGSDQLLPGNDIANMVIDPDLNTVHIFTYNTSSRASFVHYSTYDHGSDTVTSDVALIGVGQASKDGVGHPSIQDGMLFVPRDTATDLNNAVWVGLLPTPAIFSKEQLPIPAGETGVIASTGLNGSGTGYVNGDTFTVNGGILPLATGVVNHVFNNAIHTSTGATGGTGYVVNDVGTINGGTTQAHYKVLSVSGGAVTSYSLTSLGAGYSIASNVATTRSGGAGSGFQINITSLINAVADITITNPGQGYVVANGVGTTATSGVGIGLTLDILAITGKTPSCAYMEYPNGYTLPSGVTLTFDLHGGTGGLELVAVQPPKPPPGPVTNPTQCIEQV